MNYIAQAVATDRRGAAGVDCKLEVENRFGRTCFVEAVPIGADE